MDSEKLMILLIDFAGDNGFISDQLEQIDCGSLSYAMGEFDGNVTTLALKYNHNTGYLKFDITAETYSHTYTVEPNKESLSDALDLALEAGL